jgi:lipid-A-disaccharide synthase
VTRIFFSSGDTSGDIHGANLVRALRALDADLVCEGLGGQRMAEAGMALRHDLAGQGIMGFVEVVKRLRSIRRLFNETVAHLSETRPDCLVVIDFPGFNLRLAKRAAALGIPVVYYISPQVWAWKRNRIYHIAECVKRMLVILPFEEAIYRDIGMDCTYVGHPLLDHIASVESKGDYENGLVVGLLPGSREQEIERLLPVMLGVARGIRERYPEARFVTPCVDETREAQVRELAKTLAPDVPLETSRGCMYGVLHSARFCMVASGTATLETALCTVPLVIVYKVAWLSYWMARVLIHLEHIGLVNILAGEGIVPEFIQGEANAERILPKALELIEDSPARRKMLDDFARLREGLGQGGASERAAAEIMELIQRESHG